jgi:uncharacterized protein (TIGR00369 family)
MKPRKKQSDVGRATPRATPGMLEALQAAAIRGETVEGLPMTFPPPIGRLIGFRPVEIEEGATVFRLDARRDKHANPMGTMHGGILCDVADAAMGIACATLLERGEAFTTLELKINFLRPVMKDGVIEARAHVVQRGRTVHYIECDVVSVPDEKLIARAGSTCMVLRGEQAKGRGA